MSQKTRQEQDSIGKIKVSNSNFLGAQTQRTLKNFKILDQSLVIASTSFTKDLID